MSRQELRKAVETLKKTGVRITPQRHAILEYLIDSMTHPTADDIHRALEERLPTMSIATVYNNLRVLKKTGLIKELSYGDASSRFDFVTLHHYHVICEHCKKMVDFHYSGLSEIEALASRETGFQVKHHRMEIYGMCPDCQKLE